MHVDEDEVHVGREPGELAVGFAKWVIDGGEKSAALQIEDGVLDAIFGGAGEEAAAGLLSGKFGGAQQTRLVGQVIIHSPR